MWVFTPFGFFSVVAHWDKPDVVLVRGRVRADLVAFSKRLEAPRPKVVRTPQNDYPYRFELSRERLAMLLATFALDELDYTNFKAAVAERQGPARAHAYHDVWSVMRSVEDEGARSLAAPAGSARASVSSR